MTNQFKTFIKASEIEQKKMKKEYDTRMIKARTKLTVHNKLLKAHNDLHLKLQENLNPIQRFFIELDEELEDDKNKKYSKVFNSKIQAFTPELLKGKMSCLILLHANNKFYDYLKKKESELIPPIHNEQNKKSEISWIGTNKTEFIGLIYALHEAKYIEGGGITKIMNEFAKFLNFPLGEEKQWFPLHEKSINNFKSNYKPPVYDCLEKLNSAYNKLRKEKEEK